LPKGIASGSSNQWTGSAYLLDKSLDHCDLNGHIISRHSVEHMQRVSDIWQASISMTVGARRRQCCCYCPSSCPGARRTHGAPAFFVARRSHLALHQRVDSLAPPRAVGWGCQTTVALAQVGGWRRWSRGRRQSPALWRSVPSTGPVAGSSGMWRGVLRALEGCDRKGDGAACPAPWVLWVAAVSSSSPCYSL